VRRRCQATGPTPLPEWAHKVTLLGRVVRFGPFVAGSRPPCNLDLAAERCLAALSGDPRFLDLVESVLDAAEAGELGQACQDDAELSEALRVGLNTPWLTPDAPAGRVNGRFQLRRARRGQPIIVGHLDGTQGPAAPS